LIAGSIAAGHCYWNRNAAANTGGNLYIDLVEAFKSRRSAGEAHRGRLAIDEHLKKARVDDRNPDDASQAADKEGDSFADRGRVRAGYG
jgi:hypothetical protein